ISSCKVQILAEYIIKNEQGGNHMLNHYITKYANEDGRRFAVSWIQLNLFGKCYCFNIKQIII
ncbi:hypothetical protein ACX40_14795, partial [Listeria monocytogenes]|nr:hypothetical protein [Listeria monocytogenes]EAA0249190.1 hypothetical protein [Listeria monocytogenes]EAC3252993.1 hypothetical protein [Listeria monocytogenes]EAC3848220.1 hypothetical protein [Listeria monocytogenes]EAC4644358.1 hypothetical protein [Listeria monocytogenes]